MAAPRPCCVLNLILVFCVSVEQGLNLQLVHPAAEGVAEFSLGPEVKFAQSFAEKVQEFGTASDYEITSNIQHLRFS